MKNNYISSNLDISLETELLKLAKHINETIGSPKIAKKGNDEGAPLPSACSIFLYDHQKDAYILRASTKSTPYLGIARVDISNKERIVPQKEADNMGLTAKSLIKCDHIICNNIRTDRFFSCYKMDDAKYAEYLDTHYCEFTRSEIRSVLLIPFFLSEGKPDGVIRLVRSNEYPEDFSEGDVDQLNDLLEDGTRNIRSGIFLSQLIELGTHLDIRGLCTQAAHVFKDLLKAKGCSIFLLDDPDFNPDMHEAISNDSADIYKCYGTTGLIKIKGRSRESIENPLIDERAWYSISDTANKPNENKNPQAMSITMGVVRARLTAFVDNIHDANNIDNLFPENYRIQRKPGHGKICEFFKDKLGQYRNTQNIIYTPMFYTCSTDTNIKVLGVARISRIKEDGCFSLEEQHLFVSLVERLSRAVVFARLIQFVDTFSKIKDRELLFCYLVRNIPKFISCNDCALILKDLRDPSIFRIWAIWEKGKVKYNDQIKDKDREYHIHDSIQSGFSGFVAREGKALRFNGPDDLKKLKSQMLKELQPMHRKKSQDDPDPFRFMGVPLSESDPPHSRKNYGVLRACANETSPCFTEEDEHIFNLIANRAYPYLKRHIDQDEKKEQVKQYLERFFPKPIQDHCYNLTQFKGREIIRDFFDQFQTAIKFEPIDLKVKELLEKLLITYFPDNKLQQRVLENFRFFNAEILSDLPFYRDHYIHQLSVFLMGAIIIDKFYEDFDHLYTSAYPNLYKLDHLEHSWLLTALFHDTAYPFQKMNAWVNKFLSDIFHDDYQQKNVFLPTTDLLFRATFLNRIDTLADFLLKNGVGRDSSASIRGAIVDTLNTGNPSGELDHGIMSALLLLGDTGLNDDEILPCISAIALHNKLIYKIDNHSIKLDRHPLAFLLLFCDLLHEWGRQLPDNRIKPEKASTLSELVIGKNSNLIIDGKCNGMNPKFGLSPEDKCVFAALSLDKEGANKVKQVSSIFMKMESKPIRFFIRINRRSPEMIVSDS